MAQRYFLDRLPAEERFELPPDVAHHAGTVLRARPGALLQLGDGRGATATVQVTRAGQTALAVQVLERAWVPAPLPAVHVAFAPPRLPRAEWLFEHATEVGAAAFHPLWTSRSRPQGERPERWARIVRAAAGQCGRAWLPRVMPARELGDFLASPDLPAPRVVAAPGAPALAAAPDRAETVLLVGPEGGFTAAELAATAAAGFEPRGLGPHTLRTETAALVGLVLLLAR